jgi:T-complex protein 1 subunit theta
MIKHAIAAKIAVFTCALDIAQTETERTALIKNTDEIRGEEVHLAKVRHFLTLFPPYLFLSFPKDRDRKLTCTHLQIIKEIAASGIKIIIASSSVSDLALQYLNNHSIAIPKVPSKFELRRLCRVINATPLDRMGMPTSSEVGWVECVRDSRLRRGSRDSQSC